MIGNQDHVFIKSHYGIDKLGISLALQNCNSYVYVLRPHIYCEWVTINVVINQGGWLLNLASFIFLKQQVFFFWPGMIFKQRPTSFRVQIIKCSNSDLCQLVFRSSSVPSRIYVISCSDRQVFHLGFVSSRVQIVKCSFISIHFLFRKVSSLINLFRLCSISFPVSDSVEFYFLFRMCSISFPF